MRNRVRVVVIAAATVAACSSSGPGLFPYLAPGRAGGRATTFAAVDRALVRTIARAQAPRAEREPAPPIALTTSDGAGLTLARLDVDAVVTGPLALTQLHLVFHNPEPRQREGHFTITLPPDAAVSRFAMRNEAWREAEIVGRQRAREVYETYLRRRVDPALLEKGAGNSFSARVFPIAASADKELIVTYSQEVSAASPYAVPLAGLPAIGALRWSITADGRTRTGEARDRAPGDLRIDDVVEASTALVAGEAFVARVVPPVAAGLDPLGPAVILVDTSGSAAAILRREADVARAVVTAIATREPRAPIELWAFDQTIEPLAEGPAGSLDVDRVSDAIVARGGLGASDLGQALASVRADGRRLILITDGVATVGARTAAALADRARAIGAARIDTITAGGAQDRDTLAALAAAGARGGAVLDGDEPAALGPLEQTMLGDVGVSVPGARDVWPATLRGLAAGQPVVVYGRRKGDARAPLAIRFTAGARSSEVAVTTAPGPAPLVERAVGRADVARLTAELATTTLASRRGELRAAIEQLGLAHRLVTSETSLLVLETDDDYARFCIDRRGLRGLLTVEQGAIAVLDRGADVAAARRCDDPTPPAPPPVAAAGNAASLATSATTGAVAGVLIDRRTREPLIGATIVVDAGGVQQAEISDEDGWYGIGGIPAGPATFTVYYDDNTISRAITITAGSVLDLGGAARKSGRQPVAIDPGLGETIELERGPDGRAERTLGPPMGTAAPATGTTIDADYTRRVPTGRTFESALGTAAGAQDDGEGVSFSGATKNDSEYVVDGLALDVRQSRGEVITISDRAPMVDAASTAQGITITRDMVDLGSTALGVTIAARDEEPAPPRPPPPYEGRMLTVMEHLRAGRRDVALREALAWYVAEPTELPAIVALGEALEAAGAAGLAARAYGTILDRFPDRAELVRYAGERLDRLGPAARARALDAYQQAVDDRPDQATGYRLLAIAQLRAERLDDALDTLERGLARAGSDGVRAIFRGDLGLVGAALVAREPARRAAIARRLERRGVNLAQSPSVRFVLHWETDANDVDLHVRDRGGHHAYYAQRTLPTGGELLEDVTTGYGPEGFVIPGRPIAGPYRLSALYFARGAMGVGLGTVQIVVHDGLGHLTIDDRPFLLQVDHAEVDLGAYAP